MKCGFHVRVMPGGLLESEIRLSALMQNASSWDIQLTVLLENYGIKCSLHATLEEEDFSKSEMRLSAFFTTTEDSYSS